MCCLNLQVPDLEFKTLEKKGKLIDINQSEGDLDKVTNLLQKFNNKKKQKNLICNAMEFFNY